MWQSPQGALPENVEAAVIVSRLLEHVQALKASAALAGQDADEKWIRLSASCTAVAEELVSALERVRLKRRGNKWLTFRAALLSVWTRPQIEALQRRLDATAQELQLSGIGLLKYYLSFASAHPRC
jgi:hypothetical protein